jgi:hypothetical protein
VGFFDSLDDPEAAVALFDRACEWGAARGAREAVGPASFTTNDECGLLVDGFDHPPTILTAQNPRYYERLWTEAGWEPAMDLWAWRLDARDPAVGVSPRQRAVLSRVRERSGITVRSLRMDDFDSEVGRFLEVYNAAWSKNWGFAPMTEPEMRHLAKDLKRIIDPELVLIAEVRASGQTVGVALVLPDVNEPMSKVRSGRLLPLGWWHLLRGVPRVEGVRIFALGVRPEQQLRAIGPLFYAEIVDRGRAKGHIGWGEASWILATNDRMNKAIAQMGAVRSKTWRMYRRPL